jgi:peptidoglycan/xylan/chitin deacetylase (PgdA/CDA1 family)
MKILSNVSFIALVAFINVNSTEVRQPTAKEVVRKEIALTIDDLPVAVGGSTGSRSFVNITNKLVTTIQKYDIPAIGFVNSRKIASQGKKLLNMWLEANLELGNHTYSHPDLNNTPVKRFKDNIIKGENGLKDLLEKNGRKLKYFRYPCLHRGKTNRAKQEIERFLTERGYIIAPVTMDNQEWMYASVYAQAKRRNDTASINRIGREYLLHMKGIIEFFETWSLEIVGYQPKHIFLIHANSLNADYLDKVIQILLKKGYSFVSLDEVMSDEIYGLNENYIGSEGLSWIHRIAITQGIELKREPREPAWLKKMYNDFSKRN